jgi:hypothetical protein
MINAKELVVLLERNVCPVGDEYAVQESIRETLDANHIEYSREFRFDANDRVDFLVGDLALEVKTAGSIHSVMRQLMRYSLQGSVSVVLLFTTRARLCKMPNELSGKPLLVAYRNFG